ncbi:MAG TPA: type VI secretion system contractile sheath large subunit [Bryobacteraceae bacterium]|nr:type VI secretion system contractile sheath large subunit [Bryobacteraceae bacterium]
MPSSLGDIQIDVLAGRQRSKDKPEPETPFRIAVLGDFSGRANRRVRETGLAARKILRIDRDNFDQVLAKMRPELCLPGAGAIRFSELEDFHPDRLYERLDVFRNVTAGELPELAEPEPAPGSTEARRHVSLDDLLNSPEEPPAARAKDDFSRFVENLVAPHLEPKSDPREANAQAAKDTACGALMRGILHHRDFQALEAAWQGVFFLVRRIETGPELQIFLIDASKEELAADLLPAEDLQDTQAWELLVESTVGTPGAQPWSVLAGNYTFDSSLDDADLLARMAMLASAAGAPFLAGASPRILGAESLAAQPRPENWKPDPDCSRIWAHVRALPEASWVGLTLPRLLLRMPFGEHSSPIEQFRFEEFTGVPTHEQYLWGNGTWASVCLIGQAFAEAGWRMRPGITLELDDIAAHLYHDDGETKLKPCAEILLTEHAADTMSDLGLMALASLKGRDVVRLVRFQSIAEPASALSGRWGRCS